MRATWDAISHSLGNWEQGEDTDRFPSGLRALADRVRAKGMQFGLWFEPERCGPQSQLAREHPDWVSYIPGRKWGLVDLGNQAAQDYFCKTFDRYITEYGIRYIRWDMNHDLDFLLRYWATRDAPGRVGMAQIRHVEGLHRIEEYLRRRHPEVILESCAGGGNRIDLSTLALRHTIWVSDMGTDPHIVRFHLEGLNQFIPGAGQVIGVPLAPQLVRQPGFVLPDMTCQVCFAGAMGLYGRLHEWPPAVRETVRRHVDVYKTLRRFLAEDFYLLTTQARTLETWTGWQFHDAKTQQGFVQAFRLGAAESGVPLALHGLDPAAEYQFTDPYTGGGFEMSGAAALRPGLKFDLPPMSSRVLRYSRKP
jgi:alpha-galactosidase